MIHGDTNGSTTTVLSPTLLNPAHAPSVLELIRSRLTELRYPTLQMFDPATQARYPHLSAYLVSLYGHEAWARVLGVPLVAPAVAHSLESPLVAAGGQGIAERLYPEFWSGGWRRKGPQFW